MLRRIRDLVPFNMLATVVDIYSSNIPPPILITLVLCGIIAEKVYGISLKNYKIEQLE
jgi:hypothetical protein